MIWCDLLGVGVQWGSIFLASFNSVCDAVLANHNNGEMAALFWVLSCRIDVLQSHFSLYSTISCDRVFVRNSFSFSRLFWVDHDKIVKFHRNGCHYPRTCLSVSCKISRTGHSFKPHNPSKTEAKPGRKMSPKTSFKSPHQGHLWVKFDVGSLLSPRGFSPGSPMFPFPQKQTFPNSNSTKNQVDEEPLSGCVTASKSLFLFIWCIYFIYLFILHLSIYVNTSSSQVQWSVC